VNSSTFQPLTTLIAALPPLIRSRDAAILAIICGVWMPGCAATMIFMVDVRAASAEASTQASRSGPRWRAATSVISKPCRSPRCSTSRANS